MCALEPTRRAAPRAAQQGMSIIEVMIGIVVSLLVGLAAVGSATVFQALQRQGIGTGGTSINASSALLALKNDVAAAGLGFFGDSRFLCNRLNLSMGGRLLIDGADFSPVRITAEAGGDRIDVMYASQVAAGTNVMLDTPSDGSQAALRSLLPAVVGDAVLLAPPTAGDPCVVRTVTSALPLAGQARQLEFQNVDRGVHNRVGFTTPAAYPQMACVTLLGQLRWSRYRLDGTNLLLEQPLAGTSVVLLRNVIGFRVQYGIAEAAAGSTTLDEWQDATGTQFSALGAAALPRVRALRVGIVSRSPQREKPDANGDCAASTAKPDLFGATVEPDASDWQCYRYRTAIAVVPLRNLVLGLAP